MVLTVIAGEDSNGEFTSSAGKEVDLSHRYAINLQSTIVPIGRSDLPSLESFKVYQLYRTRDMEGNKIWYRWRLGFFETRREAEKVLDMIIKTFRDAWITKVSIEERKNAANLFKDSTRIIAEEPAELETVSEAEILPVPDVPEETPVSEQVVPETKSDESILKPSDAKEKLKQIMREAEEAMTGGDYRRAIQLYTKILQYPKHSASARTAYDLVETGKPVSTRHHFGYSWSCY